MIKILNAEPYGWFIQKRDKNQERPHYLLPDNTWIAFWESQNFLHCSVQTKEEAEKRLKAYVNSLSPEQLAVYVAEKVKGE